MEALKPRLRTAERALATLDQILKRRKSKVIRDAAIQRFEYTFEAVWKAAQLYLKEREGVEMASPKAVIRGSGQAGLLTKGQVRTALRMVDNRNRTVHTYEERVANSIYKRLPAYAELMGEWLAAMQDLSS